MSGERTHVRVSTEVGKGEAIARARTLDVDACPQPTTAGSHRSAHNFIGLTARTTFPSAMRGLGRRVPLCGAFSFLFSGPHRNTRPSCSGEAHRLIDRPFLQAAAEATRVTQKAHACRRNHNVYPFRIARSPFILVPFPIPSHQPPLFSPPNCSASFVLGFMPIFPAG